MRYRYRRILATIMAAAGIAMLASAANAAQIVCEGVLGNSGEQGSTLVRFVQPDNDDSAAGVGVVCDRNGRLWSRGGNGALIQYSLDGRMLGQFRYKETKRPSRADQLSLCGDTLVLQTASSLTTLPITATGDGAFKKLKITAERISSGSHDGLLAAASGKELSLLDPAKETLTHVATTDTDIRAVEMLQDGTIYAFCEKEVRKYAKGVEGTGIKVPTLAGERPQFIDGFWYTALWHGTIRRFDAKMAADPGVVLGGGSGSFIGHLDSNADIELPRGLAQVRPGIFAVSGIRSVVHVLQYQPDRRQFDILRRIGSLPYCRGLALDSSGTVWCNAGNWRWEDSPDTPMVNCVPPLTPTSLSQPAMDDGDVMFLPVFRAGKNGLYAGRFDKEVAFDTVDCDLPKTLRASVFVNVNRQRTLLAIDAKGKGVAFKVGNDARSAKELGPVELVADPPLKELTALARQGTSAVIAAADGNIVEFEQKDGEWKETRRWNSWAEDHFGKQIFAATAGDRLWVADSLRHRVLLFDLPTRTLLASFGTTDTAGASLDAFTFPETLAAAGSRCVVFDAGNQRLLKLQYR